ncbi:hypothetical protein B0T14DRAFT_566318 [Immersiella caudata]|uniref:Uncharacterized protein n=1 Tax=Immersiella caudata TaxID=314043 RepID=A0AA39WQG4_9PEZI|nr:hypothetical protein B0T14DRAFT_566318 [Immersiella caudata]
MDVPNWCLSASQPNMTEVALGIDIGSYGARAFMVEIDPPQSDHPRTYQVSSKRGNHRDDYTFYDADFPAAITVRDVADGTLVEIPAKYAFYALTNGSDNLLKQHPQADELSRQHNNAVGRRQIEAGIGGLLTTIKEQVDTTCAVKRLRVGRIGLTIPAQWTLEFEDVYRRIVSPLFAHVQPSNIQFYTEAEALGQYLLREHWDELDPENKYAGVMFLDFGGHCMNGFQCLLSRDTVNPDRSCFIKVGAGTFGAAGGSEAWMWYLKKWFYRIFHDLSDGDNATENQWNDFAKAARVKRVDPMEPHDDITRRYKARGAEITISLDQAEVQNAYEHGLGRPIEMSEKKIAELSGLIQNRLVTGPFFVLASGGSARNPRTKSQILQICKDNGFNVKFIFDLVVSRFESDAIARGAAFAACKRMSVRSWFDRGGVIALQTRENEKKQWSKTATLIIDSSSFEGPSDMLFKVTEKNSHKLICNPFHRRSEGGNTNNVSAHYSYDFLLLSKLPIKGEWYLRCCLKEQGDDVTLEIAQSLTPRIRVSGSRKEQPGDRKELVSLTVPLYVDWSSFTLHAGKRDRDINELRIAGLPPQPEDTSDGEDNVKEENQQGCSSDPPPSSGPQPSSMPRRTTRQRRPPRSYPYENPARPGKRRATKKK